jgi:ligand-binding sensor domain-containing protein
MIEMSIFKLMFKLCCLLLAFIISYPNQCHIGIQPLKVNKVITVRDGLPQSYVSGIFQDKNGFLWVSTLNGLGRYDGRGFKHYQHNSTDSSSITENIILHILDAGNNNLLICYNDGKLDLFNTGTEKATHLWKNKSFDKVKFDFAYFKSLITPGKSVCWMMAHNGGVFRIDLQLQQVRYISPAGLGTHSPVLGIAAQSGKLLLFTRSHLFVSNDNGNVSKSISYPFKQINEFVNDNIYIYSPAIRKNGDVLFHDASGMKIWNPATGYFKKIPLQKVASPGNMVSTFDNFGDYFIETIGGYINFRRIIY